MPADLYTRLLTDFQSLIVNLSLTGASGIVGDIGSNVFVKERNDKSNLLLTFPCVVVTNQGQTPEESAYTNFKADFVTFPVAVVIGDGPGTNQDLAAPTYRTWLDAISEAMRGLCVRPLLPTCPELIDVRVRDLSSAPDVIPDPAQVAGSVTALCLTARARQRNG